MIKLFSVAKKWKLHRMTALYGHDSNILPENRQNCYEDTMSDMVYNKLSV